MSLGLLSTTNAFAFAVRALCTLLATFAFAIPAHAQGNWTPLDFGLESGFSNTYEWPTAGSAFAFLDSLRGFYYPENELAPGIRKYYVTTDGGRTWKTTPDFIPVSQRMINTTFGISPTGWLTRNGGTSWQRIQPTLDPGFTYFGTDLVASDARNLVALSQPFEPDSATGQLQAIGPHRLTTSTDGGVTWMTSDSMVVETISGTNERKLELYDSTAYGYLPAPANMTDTFSVEWRQLYGMPNSVTALVGTNAFGRVNTFLQNHYYIGRLNLRTMTSTWTKLPFVGAVTGTPTSAIEPPGINFITPTIGWAIQSITEKIQGNDVTRYVFWRTADAGQTWTQNALPAWIDRASLRFMNPRLGIAMNAITTDAGATWKQWAHPFDGGAFYAADSTHYFVANRFSLFARSTDAGRTWTRNESGAMPRAIVGFDSVLVIGRGYRSILSSLDRGNTWRDADLEGSVPPTMTTVWALAMPDSTHEPKHIIGVASFISYDADTTIGIIESTDGGLNWAQRSALAGIKAQTGSVLIDFSENAEAQNTGYISTGRRLYVSTDDGATWVLRDSTQSYWAIEAPDVESVVQVSDRNPFSINTSTNKGVSWARTQTLASARSRGLGLRSFDAQTLRVLFPDRGRRNVDWNLGQSTDGGQTWVVSEHAGAPAALDGYLLWRDPDSAYAIGRYATLQRTIDGGKTFSLLKDSASEFSSLAGWIVGGMDDAYLYVSGAGNSIARWQLVAPPAAVPDEATSALAVTLTGNIATDRTTLELSLDVPSRITIDVVDVVGQTAFADTEDLGAGRHRIGINVDQLAAGMYMVRISDGQRATVLPLRVIR
ncbi:MAG: hypothetical protein H7X80_02105 [bacterium]|nr:hypothetical protein [Candidatus Kapabacteria bacterium]